MDGIILVAIIIPAFIALCQLIIIVNKGDGGTKGISAKPYITKSGITHTARKDRQDHIV
tara:strand:- start:110 stop:286 length:177 start_codon:yes stop_codon:yes gene_type:complete